MRNPVGISMKKDEIVIRISEKATYEETIECLNKKIPALKKLYKAEKTPICVTGKILKNKEIEEIKEIITKEINVKVNFDSPKELGLHGIKKAFEKEIENSETKYYKGNMRSGQKIEFEGSLVILGDVNGGAEIIAGENIVVLGILRGLAHAGAKGNKKAIIAAHRIECPQLRIANIVKEMEKEELAEEYKYASANEENQIILEK
jgi:septum site-determining protein MinC